MCLFFPGGLTWLPERVDAAVRSRHSPPCSSSERDLPIFSEQTATTQHTVVLAALPKQECDDRTTEYIGKTFPTSYDPRCRPWYQDAVADGNTGVIFTNPYADADTGIPIVTVAAPVFNVRDTTLVMGVVALDLDFSDIEHSIKDLTVVNDEGYAYLLAPGGGGDVVVHKDLGRNDDTEEIIALELGLDPDEFALIVERMNADCSGNATYSRNESTWILAWSHETASDSGTVDGNGVCGNGGYITVVTVSKDALLEVSMLLTLVDIERGSKWILGYTMPVRSKINSLRLRWSICISDEYRTIVEFDTIRIRETKIILIRLRYWLTVGRFRSVSA